MAMTPVVLMILDGWGWRDETADNAVAQAATPVWDQLLATRPHSFLKTSGLDVGLPEGQMGNSEVGHMNIGAGRVVMQSLPRIDQAIASGEIAHLPALQTLITHLKDSGGTCHVMGLVSDGGVHSHQRHMAALVKILQAAGIPMALHLITDGRDTAPTGGQNFVATFLQDIADCPDAQPATLMGRYFAMDRDHRWERTQKAYDAMVSGAGHPAANPLEAITAAYATGQTDEFIEPCVMSGYKGMQDGDGILSINFRADRVRQILEALLLPNFKGFARTRVPALTAAAGMTEYSEVLNPHLHTLFAPQPLTQTLGEVVAAAGLRQLRLAETEKYPHVTFFLNGGREAEWTGEARIMIPSPKVATYDLQPEMSAAEVGQALIEAIQNQQHELIVVNFANPDMVGHTGDFAATCTAVATVDRWMGQALAALEKAGGAALIIADHGNAELMVDPDTGKPHTAHTSHPVKAVLVTPTPTHLPLYLQDGRLADVAPTLLQMLNLPQPAEMEGKTLLTEDA